MENIWEKVLSTIKSEVNDQIYSAWFLPIQPVSINEEAIVLGVPNKFFEDWIRDKYLALIKTSLAQASGKELSVAFKIIEMPLQENPPQQEGQKPRAPQAAASPAAKDKEQNMGWLKAVFGGGTRQLPESRYQDIGLNPRYTFEHFVVGQSNHFAHAAARAVCDKLAKVYNPLFLYGGVGLGKTHLMQAMGHHISANHPRARILYISSEEFTNQLINAIRTKAMPKFRAMYRNADILLIDDVQFIAGKNSTQEEFFHTFNALYDAHKQIVLCSDRSPQDIPDLEERLVSRFAWGLTADIQLPDFETRMAIMEKKSEAEDVKVPKPVLLFLAENIKTNIREMEGALIRVVAYGDLTGKELTVALAKEVLGGMIAAPESKKISIDFIQQVVAAYFDINESDMKSKKRSRSIAYPRQIAMYLSRELTNYSLPDIGGFFGGRDHTTVLHACDKIGKELDAGGSAVSVIEQLTNKIKS